MQHVSINLIHGQFGSAALRGDLDIKATEFGAIVIKSGSGDILSVPRQTLTINDLCRGLK